MTTPTPAQRQARVNRWITPRIRALSSYQVHDAAGLIKIDFMENPYSWPSAMVEEWLAVLRSVPLNRYPNASAAALKAGLRDKLRVPAEMALLLGNGSDELIQIICLALAGPGRMVLSPSPSFSMYKMIASYTGLGYVGVPLAEDFSLDMPAMRAAIERHQPAVVFLSYPNNPTGNVWDEHELCEIIEAAPGVVVVDEAYQAFADADFMPYLQRYDNLLILRTLSKLGLAGLRLGILIGAANWLDELNKVRLPLNVNVLTEASATFALQHYDVLLAQAAQICADRAVLLAGLQQLPGVTAYPSRANFILFRVATERADEVYEGLKTHGILIRNLSVPGTALAGCLRVTVGTPAENSAFLSAMARVL